MVFQGFFFLYNLPLGLFHRPVKSPTALLSFFIALLLFLVVLFNRTGTKPNRTPRFFNRTVSPTYSTTRKRTGQANFLTAYSPGETGRFAGETEQEKKEQNKKIVLQDKPPERPETQQGGWWRGFWKFDRVNL